MQPPQHYITTYFVSWLESGLIILSLLLLDLNSNCDIFPQKNIKTHNHPTTSDTKYLRIHTQISCLLALFDWVIYYVFLKESLYDILL